MEQVLASGFIEDDEEGSDFADEDEEPELDLDKLEPAGILKDEEDDDFDAVDDDEYDMDDED